MRITTMTATTSGATNITSGALFIGDYDAYGITVTTSGTDLSGILHLEASNDDVTYITITGSNAPITASESEIYDIHNAEYLYVRVVWAYSAGTGNVTIKGYIKDISHV